ncbi:hypothetical protein GEMRC1_000247 [Eukaryota sp. GEM-RC1]
MTLTSLPRSCCLLEADTEDKAVVCPKKNSFLKKTVKVNSVPLTGTWDIACECNCLSIDQAKKANLTLEDSSLSFTLANGETVESSGTDYYCYVMMQIAVLSIK